MMRSDSRAIISITNEARGPLHTAADIHSHTHTHTHTLSLSHHSSMERQAKPGGPRLELVHYGGGGLSTGRHTLTYGHTHTHTHTHTQMLRYRHTHRQPSLWQWSVPPE